MAHPEQLQQINQIAEALDSCERRNLSFLCESPDTDNHSVGHMKEMLKSKVLLCHQNAHLFLPELMLRLGRFDILAKVYKVSRDDAERSLSHAQVLPRFRVLMVSISQELCIDDMDSLAFLLRGTLPWEKIENAKNFLDLIIELEKFDLVSPSKVDLLEQCLRNIGRADLAKKVTAYKVSASAARTPEVHLSQEESHTVSPTRQVNSLRAAGANMASPVCREQSTENAHDCYKFNSNPKGVCVIIDCVGNDGEMLEETFRALNFTTVLHMWMSAGDIHSALTMILRKAENHDDGFVCCIISRGTATHLMGTDLYGPDLSMDTIRGLVTACPNLAGKPKLFFIQRYSVAELPLHNVRQQQDEDLGAYSCDGMSSKNYVLEDTNLFWSHCWTDESHLEQEHHSIYLKALTEALRNSQRRKTNLVDVHTEVNEALFEHNKSNPDAKYQIDVKHTLLKHLYLE